MRRQGKTTLMGKTRNLSLSLSLSVTRFTFFHVCIIILISCIEEKYRFEREERKRRRREEKEKKVTRAGIEPTAAAPSQPTRLDVGRSDHSAASKETAS